MKYIYCMFIIYEILCVNNSIYPRKVMNQLRQMPELNYKIINTREKKNKLS